MVQIEYVIDNELKAEFFREFLDLAQEVERYLLKLEEEPENNDYIREVFRPFHTIKGNAGLIGEKEIQEISQLAESILDEVRQGRKKLTSEMLEGALESIDLIRSIVRHGDAKPLKEQFEETMLHLKAILKTTTNEEQKTIQPIVHKTRLPYLSEEVCRHVVKHLSIIDETVERMKYARQFGDFLLDIFDSVLDISSLLEKSRSFSSLNQRLKYLELYLTVVNIHDMPFSHDTWELFRKLKDDIMGLLYPILIHNLKISVHYLNSGDEIEYFRKVIEDDEHSEIKGYMVNLNMSTVPTNEEIDALMKLQRDFGPRLIFVQRFLGQKRFWQGVSFFLGDAPAVKSTFWQGLVELTR